MLGETARVVKAPGCPARHLVGIFGRRHGIRPVTTRRCRRLTTHEERRCVAQFQLDPKKDQKLKELNEMSTYDRGE